MALGQPLPRKFLPVHWKPMFPRLSPDPSIFLLHGRNDAQTAHCGGNGLPQGDMSWLAHTYFTHLRPLALWLK